MEEFFKIIGNYGFPIAITCYLLFRFEKLLYDTKDSISGKDGILDKLEELMDKCNDKLN